MSFFLLSLQFLAPGVWMEIIKYLPDAPSLFKFNTLCYYNPPSPQKNPDLTA